MRKNQWNQAISKLKLWIRSNYKRAELIFFIDEIEFKKNLYLTIIKKQPISTYFSSQNFIFEKN